MHYVYPPSGTTTSPTVRGKARKSIDSKMPFWDGICDSSQEGNSSKMQRLTSLPFPYLCVGQSSKPKHKFKTHRWVTPPPKKKKTRPWMGFIKCWYMKLSFHALYFWTTHSPGSLTARPLKNDGLEDDTSCFLALAVGPKPASITRRLGGFQATVWMLFKAWVTNGDIHDLYQLVNAGFLNHLASMSSEKNLELEDQFVNFINWGYNTANSRPYFRAY